MSLSSWLSDLAGEVLRTSETNPLPVRNYPPTVVTFNDLLRQTDPLSALAVDGRCFYSADADQNDLVTGQTSFANTTPSFLLDVPLGTTAIPLFLGLNQAGSVAGGDIFVSMEMDKIKRYASGGTSEKVFNARSDLALASKCALYSNPTAVAGYGIRTFSVQVAADVSPAEGAIYELVWTPGGSLDFLVGPAAWAIYTYAGTTGPSWTWSVKWCEIPTAMLNNVAPLT